MARPKKGTEAGERAAAKWRETMIEKYGSIEEFRYSRRIMGAKGGKCKTPFGGFASNRELARIAGAKGGRISRRSMRVYDDEWDDNYKLIKEMHENGDSVAEIARRTKIPYHAIRSRLAREERLWG